MESINYFIPKAIICDIDGTLALMQDRSPYDWDNVDKDLLNNTVAKIIEKFSYDTSIILVSGRDGICRDKTEQWLKKHNIHYDHLYMREAGNNEKDAIIKKRIYDQHIDTRYKIEFVLDDRNQVVKMWRDLGLICLQVADGNF